MLQKDLRYRCLLKCLRDKGGWDCFFYLASILKYLIETSARGLGLQAWLLAGQKVLIVKVVRTGGLEAAGLAGQEVLQVTTPAGCPIEDSARGL